MSGKRTTLRQCIYCRSTSGKSFPAEHVIPRSFGTFRHNLTLHCVCGDCNNFFGGNLEVHFARATGEGVVRYRYGLRNSPAPGAESEVFIARISSPGPLFGVQVRLTTNASKDGPGFDWIPQVCFEDEGATNRRWFTEDRLTPEFLKDVRFGSKVFFAVPTRDDWARLRAKLIKLGFTLGGEQKSEQFAPETKFNTRVRWSLDTAIRRCLAKIAFNHLAYITGEKPDFLGRSDFDEVRNYIRHGVPEGQNDPGLVFVGGTEAQLGFSSPAPLGGGHLIVTSWDAANRAIISQLAIFGALGYQIVLCKDYRGVWFDILKGHYFDLGNRGVREARITRQLVMSPFI
jgi:hypothetical protein